jgi:alanyl-tRNA synthetase
MGLERTLAAIQGKYSPYETDLFSPLMEEICSLSGEVYGRDENIDRAIRIVAEHSRGITFLITDGVTPSNEGRGYILRRVLRRASLFGRKLGLDEPFLNEMTKSVANAMSHVYPELVASRHLINEVIKTEEEKFIATLDNGLNLAEKLIGEASSQVRKKLTGKEVFKLYDTYGFPPELTAEIAKEKGVSIDWEGFHAEMEKQRERTRRGVVVKPSRAAAGATTYGPKVIIGTKFIGYQAASCKSKVIELIVKGKPVETASRGDEVALVLDKTPFYGEMGGQVGDTGEISSQKGKVTITNTIGTPSEVIVHQGKVVEGQISLNGTVVAKVNQERRLDIARNHTATHLLQAALRQIVDRRIEQKGSLVEPERFRFDFSYLGQVNDEQIKKIQGKVNEWIRQNLETEAKVLSYNEAINEGAIALFEEKYGEEVRMLQIGEPAISKELCGGTHVDSTGEIGVFLIISESSIGTGLHRIEAVTGRRAESLIESRLTVLQSIAKEVASSLDDAPDKVKTLIGELEAERKRALSLERELSRKVAGNLVGQVEQLNSVTVLAAEVPAVSMPSLREMGDILRDKLKSAVVVLATVYNGKPNFLAMVTPDLIARGFHAGDIINQVAKVTGGGGGGKAAMAQAGGKDPTKIDEALKLVHKLVQKV